MKDAKVFLVDDHSVVRQGLARMLEKEGGFIVCGEASNALEALELIPKVKPTVAVVDIGLQEGMNGIELVKQLRQRSPQLSVLVMSMFDESVYAERALRAGAKGYIMKHESVDKVVSAIRRVVDGKIYLSEKISDVILANLSGDKSSGRTSPVDVLSDRELEVLRLLGRGLKNSKIAEQLHLSVKTVESYHNQIKEKLNFDHASDLVQFAIQWVHSDSAFH